MAWSDRLPDINQVYKDLAQPGVQKIGSALGEVFEFLTPTHRLQLRNAKRKLLLEKGLKQLENELKDIDDKDIGVVPPELGVPIIERMTITTNDDLRALFVRLLAKASYVDTAHLAHPSFIKVIESISADEAVLLKFFSQFKSNYVQIPVIVHRRWFKDEKSYEYISKHTTELEFTPMGFQFPINLPHYFENLSGLGILEINYLKQIAKKDRYELLEIKCKEEWADFFAGSFNPQLHSKIDTERGIIKVTSLGQLFIETCVDGLVVVEKLA